MELTIVGLIKTKSRISDYRPTKIRTKIPKNPLKMKRLSFTMLLPAVLLTTALIITVDATHHSPSNNQVVGHQHGQSVAANVGHSKPSDHRLENNGGTKSAKPDGNKQKTEEPELKQCFT